MPLNREGWDAPSIIISTPTNRSIWQQDQQKPVNKQRSTYPARDIPGCSEKQAGGGERQGESLARQVVFWGFMDAYLQDTEMMDGRAAASCRTA